LNSVNATGTRASAVLVLVTFLWGLSFPLIKVWHEAAADTGVDDTLSSLTLIALRMLLALAVLAGVRPELVRRTTRREHAVGAAIGLVFFLGFSLQVLGLAHTTPAKSAFITSLGSAWVPLLAFLWFRTPLPRLCGLGLVLGITGTAILVDIDLQTTSVLGWGESLTFAASVIFAVQILLLDRLGRQVRSAHLTAGLFGVTGCVALVLTMVLAARGPGLTAWVGWVNTMLGEPKVVLAFVSITLFSTTLAFHWMNVYQPRVSASRAALIYLLEPVFASLPSVLTGYDDPTLRLILGGLLIVVGNIIAELPAWFTGQNPLAPR
jgi:drug/metabolite transporter (DMT)-like permease